MFSNLTPISMHALLSLFLALCLMAGSSLANEAPPKEVGVTDTRMEFWTDVRRSVEGQTQIQGTEAGVLINDRGEWWRLIRSNYFAPYGWMLLAVSILAITLFFLIRGRIRIEQGRSGEKMERWTKASRITHWFVATTFVLLMLTGLTLLFGKYALTPIIGKAAVASLADFSKLIHNYVGPLFAIGVWTMAVRWISVNKFGSTDVRWFLKGGGLFTKEHASAEFLNGGEKVWFWIVVLLGAGVISISGLILDFPNFDQWRTTMQWSHIFHVGAALVMMAVFFGHVYIGTLGTEGALEGMLTGKVDKNWAEQHHDVWYHEEMKRQGKE